MNVSEILVSGMTGLFVLAVGYTVIFILYQRRLVTKDLERQKLENSYQRKLLRAAIESQEAERKRIAHDLHDEIGTLLTTSKLYFNQLSPGQEGEQLKVAGTVNRLFDEMMINIRRLSHDLRPVILENFGLMEAIENIRHKLTGAGIQFDFSQQVTTKIAPGAELILYRIIQELINNTLKHACATRICLSIETHGGRLHLDYQDNGVGLAPAAQTKGLGLKSIESRLSLLKAAMKITNLDKGVQFLIQADVENLMAYERN